MDKTAAGPLRSKQPNTWRLLRWSLRRRGDWPNRIHQRLRHIFRYLSRWFAHPQAQGRWLSFLYATPAMRRLLRIRPYLLERLQRPYINADFSVNKRADVAIMHYRHVTSRWPATLFEAVYLQEGATFGRFLLKDGRDCQLQLGCPLGDREGELALNLLDAEDRRLFTFTLTFVERGLLIGCVQGAGELGREAVSAFTRAAHGLRPKNLLLSLCYAMVAGLEGDWMLYGISQAAHPYCRARDKHNGGLKLKSDYDGFWLEAGGRLSGDGFFVLPLCERSRDESQVASKHRSAFRRREALRQEVCACMMEILRR